MKEPLTDRQREIFDFLRDYCFEHGFPPSFYDIAGHFGFSPKASSDVMIALEKKGWVTREAGRRNFRFVQDDFIVLVKSCEGNTFEAGDRLIVSRVARPVKGECVVIGESDALRIEAFRGQKQIVGKVVGLCREVV